ncbi:MAG: hypothetical protein EOM83_03840 [Clostridia bacterium]|nr:hypothetical protein [Clostridia bacterium]
MKGDTNISQQEGCLAKRIENFERLLAKGDNIAFAIKDIKDRGFIVNTNGLNGFISFGHMPWKYINPKSWEAIFPTLQGKIFFGKVHHFKKDPLAIILNGETAQFKRYDLIENEKCKGVVVHRVDYGVFIDIGYNFKWRCGSIVALLHKSNFATEEAFEQIKTGDILQPTFWGYNVDSQIILGTNQALKGWFNGNIEQLIGEVLPVKIVEIGNNTPCYLAAGKYEATLPPTYSIYGTRRAKINNAILKLEVGDLIHCEVIMVNYKTKTLQLKWVLEQEIEKILSRYNPDADNKAKEIEKNFPNLHNTIENIIDKKIAEKINLIGKTVKAEVIKIEDDLGRTITKYLVEGKFIGKLYVSNDNYKISVKEKKQIERNLQNGEEILGIVQSIGKNFIKLHWKLSDEELFRFVEQ